MGKRIVIREKYSYRHAEPILDRVFRQEKKEIVDSLQNCSWIEKEEAKHRVRGKRTLVFTLDQRKTNEAIKSEFISRGWTPDPRIISKSDSDLQADFKKGQIQVEVQLGNMAGLVPSVVEIPGKRLRLEA